MNIRFFTIPNLLTLSNLLCGALAAVAALKYDALEWAFWLIVLAAVFDFFDGFAARLLRQSSPIGAELDSLADCVTFGFAPAAVLFVLYGRSAGIWLPDDVVWGLPVFLFSAAAALRLAKFNIDETQHTEFCGLPSPAAALGCISLGLLSERCGVAIPREAIVAAALVLGGLMISPLRMFALKFRGFGWRGNGLRYGFLAASAVAAVSLRGWAIPAILALYVLLSLGRRLAGGASEGENG